MLRVFLVIDDYNELIYLEALLKKLGLDVEGVQNQKKYADMSLGFNPHILITSARGKKVDGLQLTQSLYRKRGLPKVIALKSSEYAINTDDFRDSGVDEILDSPVNPRKLILTIANLGGIDEAPLLEKYAKIKGQFHNSDEAQAYVASYDENGQPVETLEKVRQNIETMAKDDPVFSLDKNDDPFRETSKIFEQAEAAGMQPQFPLQQSSETTLEPHQTKPAPEKTEREEKYEKWAAKLGPLPPKHFVRDRVLDFNKKIRADNPVEDFEEIEDERKTFVKALFRPKKNG